MQAAKPVSNRRVLIVDDSEAIHSDFDKVLAPCGPDESSIAQLDADLFGDAPKASPRSLRFDLTHATQGRQAVEIVKEALDAKTPFAIAFVDMRMPPGWDGLDTIEHIWEVDPSVQVVICTAYADHSLEQIVNRLGITDNLFFLKKPFDALEVAQLANALSVKWNLARKARLGARLEEPEVESGGS